MTDIIVVGGGLTGVMMALTLSHSPYKITLLDRQSSDESKDAHPQDTEHKNTEPKNTVPTNTVRTTTVNAVGQRMLVALGVWDRLDTTPIHQIKVAEGAAPTTMRGRRHTAFGLDWRTEQAPMAYVVQNDHLLTALEDCLLQRGSTVIRDRTATAINQHQSAAELITEDAAGNISKMTCQLVVGCDGRNSTLGQNAGIRQRRLPHVQTAIVAIMTAERPHENTAFQRFLRPGPIALMPMDGKRLSLVWTVPKDSAADLAACDPDAFNAACNAAFGDSLGLLSLDSPRLSWPLQPGFVMRPTAPRLVLAGDAAHPIHPLAGQGYNLALGDAAVLLDVLCETYARGLSAGHVSLGTQYRARRRGEVLAMSMATVGLNALFSQMPGGLHKIAGLGMSLLQRSPVKSVFADIARGGALTKASLFDGTLPPASDPKKTAP